MNKTIVALRARDGALVDGGRIAHDARQSVAASGVARCAIDVPADDAFYERLGRRPALAAEWQVVAHLWHASDAAPMVLDDDFERVHAWRVDEHVAWDHDPDDYDGSPSIGIKQISFVGKRPDITDEEFAERYREHVPIARVHHAGVRKYQQNIVSRVGDAGTSAVGGISEFWFRSVDDLIDRYYGFDDSSAVTRADSARFLDPATTTWMLVQEYWIAR